jgi:Domain of unknown function (DUF4440)
MGHQMTTPSNKLIDLEKKFWQSLVDQDTAAALELLRDSACMATAHGAIKFDHAGYRKMAELGPMVMASFALSDVEVMFPTETTAVMTHHVKQSVGARDGGSSATQDMSDTSTWVARGQPLEVCAAHRVANQMTPVT